MSKTIRAIEKCAEWLAYCHRIGWTRESLDRLEELWWEYHDERGEIRRPETQGTDQ